MLAELARLHAASYARSLPRWLGANAGDAVLPLVAATLPRLQRRVLELDPALTSPASEPLLRGYGR